MGHKFVLVPIHQPTHNQPLEIPLPCIETNKVLHSLSEAKGLGVRSTERLKLYPKRIVSSQNMSTGTCRARLNLMTPQKRVITAYTARRRTPGHPCVHCESRPIPALVPLGIGVEVWDPSDN